MSQDNDKLQRTAQMLHRIFQAAEHLRSEAIACDADNKEIIWPLVENELDRYTGIRTAQHGGKWTLFWYSSAARHETQIARIDRDELLDHATLVFQVIEKRGEIPIAVIQPEQGGITIRRQRFRRNTARRISIDDVDCFHITQLKSNGCAAAATFANGELQSRNRIFYLSALGPLT